MNIKRILLISLILVAVVASLGIVSADNSIKVERFDFNIPEGYIENETEAIDHESVSFPTNDGNITYNASFKVFYSGSDVIIIGVCEFDSPDDVKKVMDYDKEKYKGTERTINGHEGIYTNEYECYDFEYCKDNYCILIRVTDESLLESVVPK